MFTRSAITLHPHMIIIQRDGAFLRLRLGVKPVQFSPPGNRQKHTAAETRFPGKPTFSNVSPVAWLLLEGEPFSGPSSWGTNSRDHSFFISAGSNSRPARVLAKLFSRSLNCLPICTISPNTLSGKLQFIIKFPNWGPFL